MGQKQLSQTMVTLNVELSEELVQGIEKLASLKKLTPKDMLLNWILDGLERDELRFERLLLFADISKDLDEETCQLLSKLRTRYFDERADGKRGLDSYIVKCTIKHHLYRC